MPNENKKSVGKLNWPPERTYKYSITEREEAIKDGDYIEIPIISEKEKNQESR